MLPSYPRDDSQAHAEDDPQDQLRLLSLSADVGRALTARDPLPVMLNHCAQALVTHLDAAFARVWTLDEAEDVLVLRASAGQYTHLDGPHARVPVGRFKIGLIAQERAPHLTNAVIGDPRVSDQEWAKREGMVAFAGYPLVVEDRVIGVVALFARQPLSTATLQALGSVADQIAVGIERKYAEEAAQEANRRTTRILESITDAFFALSTDWRFTYLNDQAERLLSRTRANLLGRNVWDEFPAAVGTEFDRQYHRAVGEGAAVTFEAYYPPPLDSWFEVRAYPSPDGLAVYFHDITGRVGRGRRERFLAELAERARPLTAPEEVIADAVTSLGKFLGVSRCIFADIDIEADTCTIHPDYRADDSVASIEGVVPISAFGAYVVAEYAARRAVVVDDVRADPVRAPEGSLTAYEAIGIRAHVTVPVVHSNRVVSCISAHNAAPRHWEQEEVELIRTVVERTWLTVEVIRQQYALVREAEATAHILESITDAFMAFDRRWRFTYVNDQMERIVSRTRADLLGRVFWDEFPATAGSTFEREYRRAVAEQATVTFEEFYAPLDLWVEVRAYPSPDGLSVFYQDVSARKRAEEERERMLAELQARAEREALLNRIGQVLRASPDPQTVLETAVRELGQALGADRCYYAAYDQDVDTATVGPDWHRQALPSIAGQYPMSRFAVNRDPAYKAGQTQAVADTAGDPATQALGLSALVRVPLVSGTSMTALSVAMADGPRAWAADEVALVEAVATQTQTALEAVRVQRREHNIAEQLQNALQPALPGTVPGLAVTKHYEAALTEEAGVGGDFYDVFAIEKGCTALVVGDLSGKGLAAAANVSVVRNMLRAFLYSQPSLAEAVTEMNRVLAENNLLTGFATLFVGAFDGGTRALHYVNCGQEPALIRRAATGLVEPLPPTGPILGSIENAAYTRERVTLTPGDALVVFSDGLTEVGPTRKDMLGIEGLTALLGEPVAESDAQDASEMAERLARRLIAGVDAAASGGVMRDDMCLLVAVVE